MADPYVEKLAEYFRTHPVWVEAARNIKEGASSSVFFSHLEGEWHLLRRDGVSLLLEGPAPDPDLAFRFTPAAIDRVTTVEGGIGDFATELFTCITSEDPELAVDFRVMASFPKLLKRGYVQVLLRGGPKVLQFGAARGVRTLSDLKRLLRQVQSGTPLRGLAQAEVGDA